MNPPLDPSEEGNLQPVLQRKLPSSEGLGVGSWAALWNRAALPRSLHLPCATKGAQQRRLTKDCWFMVAMRVESDPALLRRIRRVIEQVEAAQTFQQIPHLKRLDATGKYYRIRVGDFRIGFVFEHRTVTFVRCLNRKEIYRYFP